MCGGQCWHRTGTAPHSRGDKAGRDRPRVRDMVDLKTTFTRSHSSEVARLSEGAATHLGLDRAETTNVKRAALFHDLGRVGIPNGVWEKPRPLSASDWERVRLHPYYSERILSRSAALAHLAPAAGMPPRTAGRVGLPPAAIQSRDSHAGQNPGRRRYLPGNDQHCGHTEQPSIRPRPPG